MEEIWKDVPEYEEMYQVSNLGRVKSLKWNKVRILVKKNSADGYHMVNLSKNGITRTIMVHKLVAMLFLNHSPNGNTLVINHINYIKTDNRATNLEIITNRENSSRKNKKNSSKYIGVYFDKKYDMWIAQIYINKKIKRLGSYKDEYEAHLAYEKELAKISS